MLFKNERGDSMKCRNCHAYTIELSGYCPECERRICDVASNDELIYCDDCDDLTDGRYERRSGVIICKNCYEEAIA